MARDTQRCHLFLSGAGAFRQAHWQPAADAYQVANGWIIKYELAGVLPNEVRLSIQGHTVSLSGLRRDVRFEERQQAYSIEISYNEFQRVIELPQDVSQMDLNTDYRDGMLIVRLSSKAQST